MRVFDTPQQAKNWRQTLSSDTRVGLVPTMGALHEGHAELVRRSVRDNDITIVSIFVNPLQFNDPEDFKAYPQSFDQDSELLDNLGVDAVFSGDLDDFFPEEPIVEEPGIAGSGLEGAYRPGHFSGVRTIVRALFECIKPNVAYFGQKDLQQTFVIRELANDLGYPEIIIVPTIRDKDGLALSSRNVRLSAKGRLKALAISKALFLARSRYQQGERDSASLETLMTNSLKSDGVEPEYCAVRNANIWSEHSPKLLSDEAYALVAAYIEDIRLIDNICLS